LFEIAHECGDSEGSWLFAWRYKLGEGVQQDEEAANSMFKIAAERGHQSAKQFLAGGPRRNDG